MNQTLLQTSYLSSASGAQSNLSKRVRSHLLIQHMFIVPLGENVECTPLCNTGFTERSAQLSKWFKRDNEKKINELDGFTFPLDTRTTMLCSDWYD